MKRMLIVLCLIALSGQACTSTVPKPPALPTILPLQGTSLSTPAMDNSSYPTVRAPQSSSSQIVSGFEVRLESAWRDGKRVYADVCFTIPDSSDWSIWVAQLEHSGQAISEFGTTLLSVQDPVGGQPGLRCDKLDFYVPPDVDLSAATLTIESLGAYPHADEYCTIYMPKIQQALTERGIAVVLGCTEENGVMNMQIVSRPATMSQEQAEQLVFSDEFYTIKGPWTFSVSLGQ